MVELAENCHVLVVDDEESVVTVVTDILSSTGYSILPAYSGGEALDIFTTNKVDLVITDIRMGGMDGFELMKRLKLVDPSIHVIVMTGHDSYDTVLKTLQAGAYDYLQKPLDNHASLLAAVDRAQSSAKLQHENTQLMLQLEGSHEKLSKANRRLVEVNHKLKRLAATDTLTLLFNRRYFDQVLKRETDRRNRYKLPLSVVLLDIDFFKQVNDKYGHEAGDNAIKQVALTLSECARTADIVARYGGEEFAVVLPQTNPANATIFAERARAAIEDLDFELNPETSIKLTISLGVTGVNATDPAVTLQDLMLKVDSALYQAKDNGRNCYVLSNITEDKNGTEQEDNSKEEVNSQEEATSEEATSGEEATSQENAGEENESPDDNSANDDDIDNSTQQAA